MKKMLLWIGALIVGVVLGWLGIAWLDGLMNFVAMVYTRLFQLLAVPTIVLAVVSTFATFGSQGSGKIFGRTVTYTLLTTLSAAIVGALLYVVIAPGNLPAEAISQGTEVVEMAPQQSVYSHILGVIPNNIIRPFLEGNVLSLLLIAFAVGIGLSKLPDTDNKATVIKGILGLQELLFLLIRWLIWTLPLGIVAFSAQLAAQVSGGVIADSLGKYVLVILGGNALQFFIILPLFLLARGLTPIRALHQEQCGYPARNDGDRRKAIGREATHSPFRTAYLHHRQYERMCCFHPGHFIVCDAERRHGHHASHYRLMDRNCRYLCHRQRRRTYGLLFSDTLTDVGHRGSRRHHGYHPAHLYGDRYGGDGRERLV